jgi:hypothetical protein
MTFGAMTAEGAFLIASRSHSFAPLIAAYLSQGIGFLRGQLSFSINCNKQGETLWRTTSMTSSRLVVVWPVRP